MKTLHKGFFISWTLLALTMIITLPATAQEAEFLTIDSHQACCFGSAATAIIPQGVSTITYISGAWNNHYSSGVYLGYVQVEIPALDLVLALGTDEQVGFSTYAEAEAAASGDIEDISNNSGAEVTAYFFVNDSCNYGGYCHDNSGSVLLSLSGGPVGVNETQWSTVKGYYR